MTRDRGIYRTMLREVSTVRTVGFEDACWDLGKHMICGVMVPYSRTMVYQVLTGRAKSERLIRRIAEKRPDLFGLRYVAESVRARGMQYVAELESGRAGRANG